MEWEFNANQRNSKYDASNSYSEIKPDHASLSARGKKQEFYPEVANGILKNAHSGQVTSKRKVNFSLLHNLYNDSCSSHGSQGSKCESPNGFEENSPIKDTSPQLGNMKPTPDLIVKPPAI